MVNDPLWFENGREFAEVFQTHLGWIIVSSEVAVIGRELHLLNFDYRPLEVMWMPIGVRAALAIIRKIRVRAAEEGYTLVVIEGIRTSGRSPDRAVQYARTL